MRIRSGDAHCEAVLETNLYNQIFVSRCVRLGCVVWVAGKVCIIARESITANTVKSKTLAQDGKGGIILCKRSSTNFRICQKNILLVAIDVFGPNAVNAIVIIWCVNSANIVGHEPRLLRVVKVEFSKDSATIVLCPGVFAGKDGENSAVPFIIHVGGDGLSRGYVNSIVYPVVGCRDYESTM